MVIPKRKCWQWCLSTENPDHSVIGLRGSWSVCVGKSKLYTWNIRSLCSEEHALNHISRWGTDIATGIKPEQQVDKSNPTTAVAAQKPLTEAQWVSNHTYGKTHPPGSRRYPNQASLFGSFFSNPLPASLEWWQVCYGTLRASDASNGTMAGSKPCSRSHTMKECIFSPL